MRRLSSMSLLWKILLSTSIAITVLFAVTGWIVQEHATRLTSLSLQEEVRASFQAYESLWKARADMLASITQVLSRMPDVRAAFSTRDGATIRDTAGEIWSRIGREDAVFFVTDPRGAVIASLGSMDDRPPGELSLVREAARKFPTQSSGFVTLGDRLYQIVVTPVYVEILREPALLNVLVAGYQVDDGVARSLELATGGSRFVFSVRGKTVAASGPVERTVLDSIGTIRKPLYDLQGNAIGELIISRSFEAVEQHIATLRRDIVLIWACSVLAGLGLMWALASRILKPVAKLDEAAAAISAGDYNYRVDVPDGDELGRLAQTFNTMCQSLREARAELIRQERIGTISRLTTSLVHDLRNPLAAIYGGAEMLVDGHLSPEQVRRLGANIYRSSRRIQELLQDLLHVARETRSARDLFRLADVVRAALDGSSHLLEAQQIESNVEVDESLEVKGMPSRLERVFVNLITNALEVMPAGGRLTITATAHDGSVFVDVEDTGPGIPAAIVDRLFQPFATAGKKNGMGLGLALSRQTILDHGGDLWLDSSLGESARFRIRLPLASQVLK